MRLVARRPGRPLPSPAHDLLDGRHGNRSHRGMRYIAWMADATGPCAVPICIATSSEVEEMRIEPRRPRGGGRRLGVVAHPCAHAAALDPCEASVVVAVISSAMSTPRV